MKLRNFSVGLVLMLVLITGSAIYATAGSEKKMPPRKVVVGTFDSRAVAVAYAHSKFHSEILNEKMAEHKKAKKAGDNEKVKELEAWGAAQQHKLHLQGFGDASIKPLLEYIKGDIPKVAKQAGVDIIVSKWDMVYQAKDAEFVDVTELIIRGFEPPAKALKSIKALKKYEPFSKKELEKHKH